VPGAIYSSTLVSTRREEASTPQHASMPYDQDLPGDVDAFLAMPTPRKVPKWLLKRGQRWPFILTLFGLIFFTMGSFLCSQFLPVHLPKQWQLERGPASEAEGTILYQASTKLSINKTTVIRHHYRFQPTGMQEMEADAFTTGKRWKEGARVPVQYLQENPSVSVIAGARMGEGDTSSLFALLFPAIGASALAAPVFIRRRRHRLLRDGRLTTATISALQQTGAMVNNQQQRKITLTRDDDGGTAVRRTHDPVEIAYAEEKLSEGQPVQVLYDPRKPKHWAFPELWKA
jgi:hypothetical protein